MNNRITDPIERIVAIALDQAGVPYIHEKDQPNQSADFYLPELAVSIEVKQFFTERILGQMQRTDNVIVIQGRGAPLAFATMLKPMKERSE